MAVASTGSNGEKLPPPPFKQIFTSVPMLALSIGAVGQNWGFYTLLTEIPTYLSDILHFSLQSVSFNNKNHDKITNSPKTTYGFLEWLHISIAIPVHVLGKLSLWMDI